MDINHRGPPIHNLNTCPAPSKNATIRIAFRHYRPVNYAFAPTTSLILTFSVLPKGCGVLIFHSLIFKGGGGGAKGTKLI
jgi:hypothetical protein